MSELGDIQPEWKASCRSDFKLDCNSDWKILVVDDEEDIREIMALSLSDAGYQVECAPDGLAGLDLLASTAPQVLITDIKMPGLNGLEVLEKAKAIRPETEVIITTGFADIQKAIIALQHDASDFITKPVDDRTLHLALKRAMQRYQDRKQLADYTRLLENENLKTSAELIKNVNYQRRLIENSMDGILGCDENDKIITYNKAMETLLGYTKAQVLHTKELVDLFERKTFLELKQSLVQQGFGGKDQLFLYETRMKSRENNEIPVQVSGSLLIQENNTHGLVLFIRDLRKIRDLEHTVTSQEKILHQEKMMSLGRLAASMVHEINNPLSGILNYIRLMIRLAEQEDWTREKQDRFKKYLNIIDQETQRCSGLVSGLLKFSRKSELEYASVDVCELIHYSLLLCNHKLELSNILLEKSCSSNIPNIYGDFNQLQQCLINLIFNAIDALDHKAALDCKAASDHKAVTDPKTALDSKTINESKGFNKSRTSIGKPAEEDRHLWVDAYFEQEEQLAVIRVKDNGKGISQSEIPYIFEPFFTTKKEGYGVGLGLSTAYGIIENHKGTIVVDSCEGQWTRFVIKLPLEGNSLVHSKGEAKEKEKGKLEGPYV